MGNDLTKEKEKEEDKKEDFQNEFIKYSIITKTLNNNQINNSTYIISSNIKYSQENTIQEFSLYGIFEGHNNNLVSNYLSKNIQKYFEQKISKLNENNYKKIIEDIFKEIDKDIKKENIKKENEIELNIKNEEKNYIKNSIINSDEIPEEYKKEINDEEINELLCFKNIFNNLYNKSNNYDYIGSSASLLLIINNNKIILIKLGITNIFLFDKEGNILNKDSLNKEYKFTNIEEKKRIKLFNKDIDYNSLILNYNIPSSRNFGFFKYKENILLKEENQIISCIPDIFIYDIKNINFILLTTSLDINFFNIKIFSEKIKKLKENLNDNIKYSDIIEEMINLYYKEKKNKKEENTNKNKKDMFNPFFGKDNYNEENIIINDLDNEYYNDVMDINTNKENKDNSNLMWIFIKLNKNIKDMNEIKEIKGDNLEIKKENIEENKK